MISRSVEYALRAMICLAANPSKGLTVNQIAVLVQLPPSYLSKVMQTLVKKKIVKSQRGKLGGFTLSCPASQLSVLNIINAIDPLKRIGSCFLAEEKSGMDLCLLQVCINDAIFTVERAFEKITIADLVSQME